METDLQLLTRCAEFTLRHTHEVEAKVMKELETSSRTPLLAALRMMRLQRAVLAVGMFSLFEAMLQDAMNWPDPFKALGNYLRGQGEARLADTINDYKLAVNVLKHGQGRSYADLIMRASSLEFTVRTAGTFFSEGDVSEVGVLVDVDDRFVLRCAELIEQAASIIRDREKAEL